MMDFGDITHPKLWSKNL